jgi:multiple sugar transport system substrate-binding protein
MKKTLLVLFVLVCAASLVLMGSGKKKGAAPAEEAAVEVPTITPGTQINVFVDGGINIVPFELFKDEIKEKSGIEVVVNPVSQVDVYPKLVNEFVAGTGAFDIVIYPPGYLPEFANNGYIIPLDPYLGVLDPKMDDIVVSFRKLYCEYGGKTYSVPYDGDIHIFYYRKDLVEDPTEKANFKAKYGYELGVPETWKAVKDFSQFFTRKAGQKLAGKTLDKDFYGTGMMLSRFWCIYEFIDHFASYGGVYFDENLTPMINSEAGVKALEDIKYLMAYAPEGILTYGYSEIKGSFLGGNIASMLLWTDLFKFSWDKAQSKIPGKIGMSHVPGTMIDGKLYFKNPLPYGRVMCIPKTCKHPAEAMWVISYMSAEKSIDFCFDPRTGEDPFRYSHINAPDYLAKYLSNFAGTQVPVKDCEIYLQAIKEALENGYPDLSIPGSAEYMDSLAVAIQAALAGDMTVKAALDKCAKEWTATSESLGIDTQKVIWKNLTAVWKELGLI